MIRCTYAICADSVIRDTETNNISLISILEEFKSRSFPVLVARAHAAFLLTRETQDAEEMHGTLRITLNDDELYQLPVQVSFEDKKRARLLVQIQGLLLPGPGQLRFSLRNHDGGELEGWEIEVSSVGMKPDVEQVVPRPRRTPRRSRR